MAYRRRSSRSRGRSSGRRSFSRRRVSSRSGGARRSRRSYSGGRQTVRLEIVQPAAHAPSGALVPQFNDAGRITGFNVPAEPRKAKF